MDPNVPFLAGLLAAGIWDKDEVAGILVHQGVANIVGETMVMTYPIRGGGSINVIVEHSVFDTAEAQRKARESRLG